MTARKRPRRGGFLLKRVFGSSSSMVCNPTAFSFALWAPRDQGAGAPRCRAVGESAQQVTGGRACLGRRPPGAGRGRSCSVTPARSDGGAAMADSTPAARGGLASKDGSGGRTVLRRLGRPLRPWVGGAVRSAAPASSSWRRSARTPAPAVGCRLTAAFVGLRAARLRRTPIRGGCRPPAAYGDHVLTVTKYGE